MAFTAAIPQQPSEDLKRVMADEARRARELRAKQVAEGLTPNELVELDEITTTGVAFQMEFGSVEKE